MSSKVLSIVRTISPFCADLPECNSRQNSPTPISSSLFFTTCSAACFSATNSTRFPRSMALAIMFVIVWLLPVPGGPCSTNVVPFTDSETAAYCDESQGSGVSMSSGSLSSSLTPLSLFSPSLLVFVKRLDMSALLRYTGILVRTSAHMA